MYIIILCDAPHEKHLRMMREAWINKVLFHSIPFHSIPFHSIPFHSIDGMEYWIIEYWFFFIITLNTN